MFESTDSFTMIEEILDHPNNKDLDAQDTKALGKRLNSLDYSSLSNEHKLLMGE